MPNATLALLPLSNYSLATLNRIQSLTIRGSDGERGPLRTLPPNICFLPNLHVRPSVISLLPFLITPFSLLRY